MPCPREGSRTSLATNQVLTDWAGIHPYQPKGIFTPGTLGDLVAVVQEVEKRTARAKAVGSDYSLSNASVSDGYVISLAKLNKHLSQPFPAPASSIPASRVASLAADAGWLAVLARPGLRRQGNSLVHVQGGIRIKDLLADLASADLALPTMGAGGGQTLVGALATGTHGGDAHLPVLGDAVRAIHLVGPGGEEWWIEPNAGSGAATQYSQLPDWCPDTVVVRDSDLLTAVAVGLGRFGVIYSMVLEVVPQYRLEEKRNETTWAAMRTQLMSGNIFADPLVGEPLRFWQLVIDPASGTRAWRTRRWVTRDTTTVDVSSKPGFMELLCTSDPTAAGAAVAAGIAASTLVSGIGAGVFALYIGIPFAGLVLAPKYSAPYFALAEQIMAAVASFSTVGAFIGRISDLARNFSSNDPILTSHVKSALDDAIAEAAGAVLDGQHDPPLRRGLSHQILDTHNYDLDGCFSVNSAEYFFDGASTGFIQFVDSVLANAKDIGPVMGSVAIRTVGKTAGKLGMERFGQTIAVEVALLRPGSINAGYMKAANDRAREHGGIPHWGQQHTLTDTLVEGWYGNDLDAWRWAVAETEAAHANTFRSKFTTDRGLDPKEPLSRYRARHYVAALASGLP